MPLARALVLIVAALALSDMGARATPLRAQQGLTGFSEGFEADTGWKVFEEVVSGSPCYATGAGAVTRTSDYAFAGAGSLSVWANRGQLSKSNHLIAYSSFTPADARAVWRYRARVLIPAASQGRGQTGPELSLQNTRAAQGGGWTTATAGLQYVANPHLPDAGGWHIWAETAPGVANWSDLIEAPLVPGQWYTVTLEVDYGTNRYLAFELEGPGGRVRAPLAGRGVAEEAKGFAEPSFVLTLESENLWNNCDGLTPFDYQVLYDQVEVVMLHRLALPLLLAGS